MCLHEDRFIQKAASPGGRPVVVDWHPLRAVTEHKSEEDAAVDICVCRRPILNVVKVIMNKAWYLQTRTSSVTIRVYSLNTKVAIIVYCFSSECGKQLSVSVYYPYLLQILLYNGCLSLSLHLR